MENCKKYLAEMLGTMVLVLMGCGAAVFNAGGTISAAWVVTVAFAFGLSVVAMAYTIGSISGCHVNPAITLAAWLSKRISCKDACWYMVSQVLGAFMGSAILYLLVSNGATTGGVTTTGANGFADGQMTVALISEIIFTFIFVLVVLGATSNKNSAPKFAGLAIGLSLVLVHIICIPITGTSVNPARSIAPAFFQGGLALTQLWVFVLAPFVGAVLAAGAWTLINPSKE